MPVRKSSGKQEGTLGEELTAADMKKMWWLQPKLVAAIEYAEWTPANHLRHSKFIALREDKGWRPSEAGAHGAMRLRSHTRERFPNLFRLLHVVPGGGLLSGRRQRLAKADARATTQRLHSREVDQATPIFSWSSYEATRESRPYPFKPNWMGECFGRHRLSSGQSFVGA